MDSESEECYNPHHPVHLHEAHSTQYSQDDIPTTFGAQTIESPNPSPAIAKKCRAWVLLIVPGVLLLMIAVLFCVMLLWLLHHHVDFDPSFASATRNELIVDQAAQWCKLLSIADHGKCDLNQAPSLLGLALSGILVSRQVLLLVNTSINKQLNIIWTEQDHLFQHHIYHGYGHPLCRIELAEGYFCWRNAQYADAPAVSKT